MFTEKRLMFLYSVSPVHMGSGTSLGVIDNPIQRERHTEHPVLAGSGLKGAARELAQSKIGSNGLSEGDVVRIFGPDTNASEHAGAVSFSDGQVVAFPVRSLRQGFVYATSPLALERLKRLAGLVGIDTSGWELSEPSDDEAVVLDKDLLIDDKLILESYEYEKKDGDNKGFQEVANWLANNALPKEEGYGFFKEKLKKHLVLLSENQFSYFVRNATVVEPHVRINDVTGTAEEGGLFFTENVPPESLFVSLVMASQERKKKGDGDKNYLSASEVMGKLQNVLHDTLLQIGGDATTGRGQMWIRFVGEGGKKK